MSEPTARSAYTTQRWMEREWLDGEPTDFSVCVQTDNTDGKAFVVVSGDAVWLSRQQVAEVILHLAECRVVMDEANKRLAALRVQCDCDVPPSVECNEETSR